MEEKDQDTEPGEAEDEVELVADAETATEEAAAKLRKLRDDLKRCETERREYLDGWQRAKADFINYKKDEVKRFGAFSQFATEELVAEIIPVLDGFGLALEHDMPKDVERGIVLIRSQLEDALRRRGLEVIAARGERFNPEVHESLGEVENDGEPGIVVEELQRGYRLNGKVLRPARVKISKGRRY